MSHLSKHLSSEEGPADFPEESHLPSLERVRALSRGASQLRQENKEGGNQRHVPLAGGRGGFQAEGMQVQRSRGESEASAFGESARAAAM